MATSPDYSALVAQAEKAVQGVKDPELRRIAYQKVLEELLGGGRGPSKGTTKRRTRQKASTGVGKSSGRGPKKYITEMHEDGFFKKPKTMTEVRNRT
jgi:hypothetical protein